MPDIGKRLLTATVDLSLLTVRERLATNRIKWDLLVLFGRNAEQSFTPWQAARLVRRPPLPVAVELRDLHLRGAIVPKQGNGEESYRLTHDPLTRALIIHFARTNIGAPPARRRFTS